MKNQWWQRRPTKCIKLFIQNVKITYDKTNINIWFDQIYSPKYIFYRFRVSFKWKIYFTVAVKEEWIKRILVDSTKNKDRKIGE